MIPVTGQDVSADLFDINKDMCKIITVSIFITNTIIIIINYYD